MTSRVSWVGLMALVTTLSSSCGLEAIPFLTCGPGNCTGCCEEGVCRSGADWAACGAGGAVCGACAPHEACMSQACGMDPAQVWVLTPVSAVIADTNNGSTWDDLGGPAPDPYVRIGSLQTPEAADTWTPTWNAGFEFTALELFTGVSAQVMDSDAVSDDSITPAGMLQFTEADFARGGTSFGNWGGVVSIDFALQRKQ